MDIGALFTCFVHESKAFLLPVLACSILALILQPLRGCIPVGLQPLLNGAHNPSIYATHVQAQGENIKCWEVVYMPRHAL